MSLELAHSKLGWPSREEILKPSGEGAQVFARLAQAKIGGTLARQPDGAGVRVGVLSPNPAASATEPPLAVVCEFQRSITGQTLREMQKLAWNFSRCPMLVTVEPHLLRAWTCCEPPSEELLPPSAVHELQNSELAKRGHLSTRAAQALHWVNLVSGQFFKDNASRFRRDRRADQLLLENLRFVRQTLREKGLEDDDVCHDLLARVIFIQFLFDRKDSTGKAALNAGTLERLHNEDVLKIRHENFASILANYQESYRLFYWLNERFNGDLFPGKGNTEAQREEAWQEERRLVKPPHLGILERFVSGRLEMPKDQFRLWREYAFDAIPLEFISSIYEAFVSERARTDEAKEESGLDVELLGERPPTTEPGTRALIAPRFLDIHRITDTHEHIGMIYLARPRLVARASRPFGSENHEQDARATLATEEHHDIRWCSAEELDQLQPAMSNAVKWYCRKAIEEVSRVEGQVLA